MNKPITMVIKETQSELARVCNKSGLSPIHLDLIVRNLYSEVHSLAERQAMEEEMAYVKMLEESSKDAEIADKNVS